MVTLVPTLPLVGEKLEIVGADPPPPPPMNSSYSSRLGEPVPGLFTTPLVAFDVNALATDAGVALVLSDRYSAETPVVCGVAIDVPLMVFVAVLLEYQSDVMLTPGPKMSTHVPKFENDARVSVLSVAATVMAAPTRAGDVVQASVLLLPAAMQNVTPALIAPLTASSS